MGKLIREASRDMVPFAFEVWLGQNAIIFISKNSFNRTNEKRNEKGNDGEE